MNNLSYKKTRPFATDIYLYPFRSLSLELESPLYMMCNDHIFPALFLITCLIKIDWQTLEQLTSGTLDEEELLMLFVTSYDL